MLAGTWLLLRSVLPPWPSLVPFVSACMIGVYFSLFNELFFATEVLGIVLVLRRSRTGHPTWTRHSFAPASRAP